MTTHQCKRRKLASNEEAIIMQKQDHSLTRLKRDVTRIVSDTHFIEPYNHVRLDQARRVQQLSQPVVHCNINGCNSLIEPYRCCNEREGRHVHLCELHYQALFLVYKNGGKILDPSNTRQQEIIASYDKIIRKKYVQRAGHCFPEVIFTVPAYKVEQYHQYLGQLIQSLSDINYVTELALEMYDKE